jgi:2-polyprenyl-3-methyl-5-hydroxy-6-metoxy-1,4-benzoquinol methylase
MLSSLRVQSFIGTNSQSLFQTFKAESINCDIKMERNIRIIRRRGIPYPPLEIQSILINHYLQEKEICSKIRQLNRDSPLRTKLFAEVYEIAHAAMEKYVETGFMQYDILSNKLFGKNIDKLFTKRGHLLELGCGRGYLLLTLKELGWDCKGVDIDISHALKEIKEEVESADILFYNDTQHYDLIVIDQVLEHIPKNDCLYFLKNLHGMLKKGGFLVSRTPNRLTGPHDVSRWFIPLGTKAEGTHFNEMTLTETISMMKKAGFRSFKTPNFPFPSIVPSPLRLFIFWTKNQISFATLFEKIYPFLPYNLKPTTSFPIFVPNTIAAQK